MIAGRYPWRWDKPEWLTSVEAVFEVLNEGVVITNENHRILFTKAHFLEMTGIPKRHLIGFSRITCLTLSFQFAAANTEPVSLHSRLAGLHC